MPEVEREKNESAAVSSPLQAFWKVFLKKIAISRRLLWEELKRLKIKRLDLAKADLRLGEKAYATSMADGQAEFVSRLNEVTRRVAELRQEEVETVTFGEKAKAFATKIAKAVQLGALQLKRRRMFRRLRRKALSLRTTPVR